MESQRLLVRRFLSEGHRLDHDHLTMQGDSFAVTQQGYVHDGHLSLCGACRPPRRSTARSGRRRLKQLRTQLAGMGRDVHDSIGQLLTGIRLLAENLASHPEDASVPALAGRIATLAERAHAEVQALGRSLSAAVPLGFEFRRSLEDLCEVATAAGVPCRVTMGEVPALPPIVHLHLFRIAQEGVSNALRHAQARRIDVRFEPAGQGVALVVEDDGVGLAEPSSESEYGVGMANMRARAEALQGDFYVEVRPEGGTRVYCGVAAGRACMSAPARIFAIDDHPVVVEALRTIVEATPGLVFAGSAMAAAEALDVLSRTGADLVVLDLSLADGDGLDLLHRLHHLNPALRVLVFSMHPEDHMAELVLRARRTGLSDEGRRAGRTASCHPHRAQRRGVRERRGGADAPRAPPGRAQARPAHRPGAHRVLPAGQRRASGPPRRTAQRERQNRRDRTSATSARSSTCLTSTPFAPRPIG